jgi:hypothetical protein
MGNNHVNVRPLSTSPNSSPYALRKSRSRNLLEIQIQEYAFFARSLGVFSKLPKSTAEIILKYLGSDDLCRLSCVSKGFRPFDYFTYM